MSYFSSFLYILLKTRDELFDDGDFGFRSAVTSYFDVVFDRAFKNIAVLMIHCLLYWDGIFIRRKCSMTVILTVLTLHFFYGSSNLALWNIDIVVSLSGTDTEWEPGIPTTLDTINYKV